jgi:hypothetical protein
MAVRRILAVGFELARLRAALPIDATRAPARATSRGRADADRGENTAADRAREPSDHDPACRRPGNGTGQFVEPIAFHGAPPVPGTPPCHPFHPAPAAAGAAAVTICPIYCQLSYTNSGQLEVGKPIDLA